MNKCKTESILIKGPQFYAENSVISNSKVLLADGKIKAFGNAADSGSARVLKFPTTWHLIPGMIDLHVHGVAGADTMDASAEAFTTISSALSQDGVTSFLLTTMSASKPDIAKILEFIGAYDFESLQSRGAEVLGVYLEGPFLAAEKAGTQKSDYFQLPEIELFNHWQELASGLIKVVVVAPELENGLEFIKHLSNSGVVAAIGHSNAGYETTQLAIAAGASEATHMFNGMRGIHHREPGMVTAVLLDKRVLTEVIADGVHLHPSILQLIVNLKGTDKTVLITDSMRANHLSDGCYEFGGQQVVVKNGEARLDNDTLAGSVLTMDQAVRNMLAMTDCSLADIVQMTAVNPAKQLGVFANKGSIAGGKDADLVIMDENYRVRLTICGGNIVFSAE